jgi:hypothetical protein
LIEADIRHPDGSLKALVREIAGAAAAAEEDVIEQALVLVHLLAALDRERSGEILREVGRVAEEDLLLAEIGDMGPEIADRIVDAEERVRQPCREAAKLNPGSVAF